MATRIPSPAEFPPPPDPVAPGVGCAICWGVGKSFGDVDTPSKVQLTFSGINKGPNWIPANGEPLNGTYILDQLGGFPCTFRDTIVGLIIQWSMTILNTSIRLTNTVTFTDHFIATIAATCLLVIDNQEDDHFTGGTVEVTLPDTT